MNEQQIDTEALRRLVDAAMVEPPWEDAGEWQTDGYAEYIVVSCEQDSDGEYGHVAEAANERLGAFIAAADPNTVRVLLDMLDQAEARIQAVRELHVPDRPLDKHPDCSECTIHGYCEDDTTVEWPCPTIRALDGER